MKVTFYLFYKDCYYPLYGVREIHSLETNSFLVCFLDGKCCIIRDAIISFAYGKD